MRSPYVLMALGVAAACTRNAPTWTTVDDPTTFEALGAHGPVSLARVRLDPSETFRFAAGPCQEVMVVVERGVARADLAWFKAGEAVRFHTPTVLQAMSDEGADLFAVAVTHVPEGAAPPDWSDAPRSELCGPPLAPMTRTIPGAGGPFAVSGGGLDVRIYLDAGDAESDLASLVGLRGTPRAAMSRQVHDAAEALWIERGSGVMRVGTEEHAVQSGTFVFVPAGTPHSFVPDGAEPLVAYQVYTPSGPGQRFRLEGSRGR